ncbi:MAG: hypothetical protein ACREX0_02485 [Noviherbaspirillum sp.]
MTSPENQNGVAAPTSRHTPSIARINRLIAELEQELAQAPEDTPHLQDLKAEVETFKSVLRTPGEAPEGIAEGLHAIRNRIQRVANNVEGEILRDSPVVAEIGRILGLV